MHHTPSPLPQQHEPLGRQLRAARVAAGVTQAELAKRLGVNQTAVSRIETDPARNHTVQTLMRYLEALDAGYSLELRVRREPVPPSP
jgi:transcriptional regulator with XRE-family HTH domain